MTDDISNQRPDRAPSHEGDAYRSFFERAVEGMYITTPAGAFVLANVALARILGYADPDDLILSTQAGEIYADRSRRAELVARLDSSGAVTGFESQVCTKDGSLRWVRENTWVVRGLSGGPDLYEGMVIDITESRLQHEDLLRSRNELAEANRQLKENQSQLLQSEKLATIGQLAAGVAHEINNPVGFLLSNLNTLGEYVTDLFALVDACEKLSEQVRCGETDLESQLAEIQRRREDMDLPFVREDLVNLVTESREGAERVRKIVRDLRDFSHLDRKEKMLADINAGIEATLNIVWNGIKYRADVVKDYGDLPEVECFPMELNQVFMNLFINAAQAIQDRGTIRIRSYLEGDFACVDVSDDGVGMTPKVQARVFDPFFTTKAVGEGTGLGLSMSYNIVTAKHGGQITVESELGRGTTFTVRIPLALDGSDE